MTADEYFEKHPELRKKFDDEIRNDYWGYWLEIKVQAPKFQNLIS